MPRVAFGLGSNLGAREHQLARACEALMALEGMEPGSLHVSPPEETAALLPEGAPPAWNLPYLNQVAVAAIDADSPLYRDPLALLSAVKHIERTHGRQDRGHWAPREIDIDILAMEGVRITSPSLTLPHPRAHERPFVYRPLATLWPEALRP